MSANTAAPSILIDDRETARILAVSRSHLHALRADGRFGPESIKLGRALRFNRQEVLDWIAAGCPEQRIWQARKAMEGRRVARGMID